MKYYTSQELSKKLSINLAKWKRWAREFLPPDPLGGFQSGYARQYTREEAFIVFLGGYAVSDLSVPIPETKKLLKDLQAWLEKNSVLQGRNGDTENPSVLEHVIILFRDTSKNIIFYHIHHVMSRRNIEKNGISFTEKRYFDEVVRCAPPGVAKNSATSARVLYLTRIYKEFVEKLESHI